MGEKDLADPNAAHGFVFNLVAKTFRKSTDVDSCVTLAGKIDQRFGETFDHFRELGAPIACKAGCSYCCSWRVEVVPHEAIALFRYLKSQIPSEQAEAITEKVLANANKIGSMSEGAHKATNIQCAFLVNGQCSAYNARPMACAWHHSLDVDECRRDFENPGKVLEEIPQVGEIVAIRKAAQTGASAALHELRLNGQPLELHTAVAALLRDPGVISKWRTGGRLIKSK